MENFVEKVKNVFNGFSDWTYALSNVLLIIAFIVMLFFTFVFLKNNESKKVIVIFVGYFLIATVFFILNSSIDNRFFLLVPVLFVLAMIALYATEIKHAIRQSKNRADSKVQVKNYDEEEVKNCISAIITALQNMSKKDIGALIVLSNNNVSSQILDSGITLNSDISSELIESVFFPKTPLHDGAMIINGTKIVATGCFLPLSQNENIPKDLGTRHRAGIGITETTDVTALIVSEETGIISIVRAGKVTRYADMNMLKNTLSKFYWQDLAKN